MKAEKYIRIARGLIKAIIPIPLLHAPAPPVEANTRYCYTMWLRYLVLLHKYQKDIPHTLAELGPGDSLGTGIAALLCGCEKYIGLDIFTYGNPRDNVKIFDELVVLFKDRTPIPAADEFPNIKLDVDSYEFPAHILTEDVLARSLAPERLEVIRKEIASPALSNTFINYFVPWQPGDIKYGSIDLIISIGVLQYTKLQELYPVMHAWLKPGGMMAHGIDFSSLGSSKIWNGQWAYSSMEWKLFSIGKKIMINRSWVGLHKEYLAKYNFNLLDLIMFKKKDGLHQNQLAKEFRHLTNDDVETYAAFMVSAKVN